MKLSSETSRKKFQENWIWLSKAGHTQLKVLVPNLSFLWQLFLCKNLTDQSLSLRGTDDYRKL